jgi:hypothetical protein
VRNRYRRPNPANNLVSGCRATVVSYLLFALAWCNATAFVENFGNIHQGVSRQKQVINFTDDFRTRPVYNPFFAVVWVSQITEWRPPTQPLSGKRGRTLLRSDFFGSVFCIHLIHYVSEWKYIVIQGSLTAVNPVTNRYEADTSPRQNFLRVKPDMKVISAETTHVLNDYR